MGNAYYNPSTTNKWDDSANWFSDPTFTTPLVGGPQLGDDLYIYGTIDGYDSTPPLSSYNSGTFIGNGLSGGFAVFCSVSLTFSGDATFDNGYALSGMGLSLSANNVTFNGLSGIGGGAGGYYYPVTVTASSNITFNNNSYNYLYGGSLYGNVILNNSVALYDVNCYNNVTLNNSSTINKWNIMGGDNSCLGTAYLKDTSSITYILFYNNPVIYYPGTATISNYTFMTSGKIVYAGYSTLYLYNPYTSTSNWSILDEWFVDAAHTQSSAEFPGISTDVVIDTSPTTGGVSNICNTFTIGSSNYIGIDISVTTLGTFNDSSYLNTSYTITGNCLFTDSSHNEGTVNGNATFTDSSYNTYLVTGNAIFGTNDGTDTAYTSGTVNGTSTFYASCNPVSGAYLGGAASFYDSSYIPMGATINNSSTLSFYDNSINYSNGIVGTFTCDFNNNATNYTGAAVDTGVFNDNSSNLGSCNNATYNDASVATSGTYSSNLNISISGDPVNSYIMDTSTYTYTFTRGAGGGGGGINGSSILGIL